MFVVAIYMLSQAKRATFGRLIGSLKVCVRVLARRAPPRNPRRSCVGLVVVAWSLVPGPAREVAGRAPTQMPAELTPHRPI